MGGDQDAARRIALLREEHRDLDSAIAALLGEARTDQLRLAWLKKRKLRLRDEIAAASSMMIPDIIA